MLYRLHPLHVISTMRKEDKKFIRRVLRALEMIKANPQIPAEQWGKDHFDRWHAQPTDKTQEINEGTDTKATHFQGKWKGMKCTVIVLSSDSESNDEGMKFFWIIF